MFIGQINYISALDASLAASLREATRNDNSSSVQVKSKDFPLSRMREMKKRGFKRGPAVESDTV